MDDALPIVVPSGKVSRQLRAQVEAAVAEIVPAGKRGAFLAIAGHEGTTVTVATKIGDDWILAADANRKWSGEVSGQVRVVGSW